MRIGDVLGAKPSQEVVTITPDAGVRDLIALLAEHNVGALIVSADGTSVDGIVSERDVVRHLHADGTVVDNTVGAIMTAEVETCAPDTMLDDLMKVMTERRIRHVPVCEDGRLVGMITDRDIAIKVVAAGKDPKTCKVSELEQGKPVTIGADDSVDEILRTMKQYKVRRLPVIDGQRLVGMVSQGDVANNIDPERVGELVDTISD